MTGIETNSVRLLACGASVCSPHLKIRISKSHDLYLVNEGDTDLHLPPSELFGFGLGGFSEGLAVQVGGSPPDCFPWLLKNDTTTLIFQSETGGRKKPMSLASLFCHMASTRGIMDVTVTDHNVTPLCSESGEARMFRYSVQPKSKVAGFTPKVLEDNLMNLRATVIGGAFHGKFDLLPKTDAFRVCWEVSWLPIILQ